MCWINRLWIREYSSHTEVLIGNTFIHLLITQRNTCCSILKKPFVWIVIAWATVNKKSLSGIIEPILIQFGLYVNVKLFDIDLTLLRLHVLPVNHPVPDGVLWRNGPMNIITLFQQFCSNPSKIGSKFHWLLLFD